MISLDVCHILMLLGLECAHRMTDGIIQKTIKEYFKSIEFPEDISQEDMIDKLIEKIKQIPIEDYFYHYQPNHHSCGSKCNLDIIRTLIGDNKDGM